MNFALQREIYGLQPWMVDLNSLPVFTAMLRNFQMGVSIDLPEEKYNTAYIFQPKNAAMIVYDQYELDNQDEFEGIAIINLNGPITKGGGLSTVGMQELSVMMLEMADDSRIKGFMVVTDSGGGSAVAVEIMNDAIIEVAKTKPVYALITKGGMACSAAYGIISGCHKIYSDGAMNVVGSIGTMIEFCGKAANSDDLDGFKYVRIYATKSTMKNKGYEEALKGNYEFIVNDMLDPMNENFINMIATNRPAVKSVQYDDGRTFFSKDAIGSLIDGIASFSEVVDMIQTDAMYGNKPTKIFDPSIINNSVKMNKEELKSKHPETYNEVVQEGVTSEKERVDAWMVHASTDPEAVAAGIESGKHITAAQTQKMLVKMQSNAQLDNLKNDSPKDVATDASKTEQPTEANEVDKHYAELDQRLGFTKK